jgi:hypothetical protein
VHFYREETEDYLPSTWTDQGPECKRRRTSSSPKTPIRVRADINRCHVRHSSDYLRLPIGGNLATPLRSLSARPQTPPGPSKRKRPRERVAQEPISFANVTPTPQRPPTTRPSTSSRPSKRRCEEDPISEFGTSLPSATNSTAFPIPSPLALLRGSSPHGDGRFAKSTRCKERSTSYVFMCTPRCGCPPRRPDQE